MEEAAASVHTALQYDVQALMKRISTKFVYDVFSVLIFLIIDCIYCILFFLGVFIMFELQLLLITPIVFVFEEPTGYDIF